MTIYRMVPGFHRTLEVQFARSVVLVCCSVHQQSDKRNIKRWHQKCDPICWHHPAVRDSDTRRSGLHRDVFLHLWNKLSVWCGRAEENPRCQPQRRVRFHFLSISKPNMNPFPSLVFVAVQTGGLGEVRRAWGLTSGWGDGTRWGSGLASTWQRGSFFQQMATAGRWSERQFLAPPTSQRACMTFAFYSPTNCCLRTETWQSVLSFVSRRRCGCCVCQRVSCH